MLIINCFFYYLLIFCSYGYITPTQTKFIIVVDKLRVEIREIEIKKVILYYF